MSQIRPTGPQHRPRAGVSSKSKTKQRQTDSRRAQYKGRDIQKTPSMIRVGIDLILRRLRLLPSYSIGRLPGRAMRALQNKLEEKKLQTERFNNASDEQKDFARAMMIKARAQMAKIANVMNYVENEQPYFAKALNEGNVDELLDFLGELESSISAVHKDCSYPVNSYWNLLALPEDQHFEGNPDPSQAKMVARPDSKPLFSKTLKRIEKLKADVNDSHQWQEFGDFLQGWQGKEQYQAMTRSTSTMRRFINHHENNGYPHLSQF